MERGRKSGKIWNSGTVELNSKRKEYSHRLQDIPFALVSLTSTGTRRTWLNTITSDFTAFTF